MAKAAGSREDRLKAALKANMARRKAQTKARGTVPNHDGRSAAAPGATRTDDGREKADG